MSRLFVALPLGLVISDQPYLARLSLFGISADPVRAPLRAWDTPVAVLSAPVVLLYSA